MYDHAIPLGFFFFAVFFVTQLVHAHSRAYGNMLRKRGADLDLPMASGGRSPTPPRRQLTMPDATPANVFSSIWVLVALALIGAGWVHCSLNREESRLYCAEDVCRFSRDSPDNRRYADANGCAYFGGKQDDGLGATFRVSMMGCM